MIKSRLRKSEKGASVLDLSLAVVGAMAMLGTIFSFANQTLHQQRVEGVAQDVAWVIDRTKALKRTSLNFTNINNTLLIANSVLPDGIVSGPSAMTHGLGGSIDVVPVVAGRFAINLSGTGKEDCIDVATSIWGLNSDSIFKIRINGVRTALDISGFDMNAVIANCAANWTTRVVVNW